MNGRNPGPTQRLDGRHPGQSGEGRGRSHSEETLQAPSRRTREPLRTFDRLRTDTDMLGVRVAAASPARSSAGGRGCERSSGLRYGLLFIVDFDLVQYPVDGGADTESLAEKML